MLLSMLLITVVNSSNQYCCLYRIIVQVDEYSFSTLGGKKFFNVVIRLVHVVQQFVVW